MRDGGPIWLPDDARRKAGPCQLAFSGDVASLLAALVEVPEPLLGPINAGQPEIWTYEEYVRLMAAAQGTGARIGYASRAQLDAMVGGTYRIPLPYPASFDVRRSLSVPGYVPTSMATWVRATGAWFDAHGAEAEPAW